MKVSGIKTYNRRTGAPEYPIKAADQVIVEAIGTLMGNSTVDKVRVGVI